MQRLYLHHLPFLRASDVIVTPRPWSPLLEALLLFRPARRPRIVQVADGVVFPLNAAKRKNRRYGGLQKHIFADCFVARQNAGDFALISDDPALVQGAVRVTMQQTAQHCDAGTAVLVAGNDPFFDLDPQRVIAAFVAVARQLRSLGVARLLLSCPEPRLAQALTAQIDGMEPIGRISDYDGDTTRLLLVGSPSTVLLEHQAKGGLSLLLSCYEDAVLRLYLSPDSVLAQASAGPDKALTVTALAVQDADTQPLPLAALLQDLPRRDRPALPRGAYLKNLTPKLILRELHLLLGGRA